MSTQHNILLCARKQNSVSQPPSLTGQRALQCTRPLGYGNSWDEITRVGMRQVLNDRAIWSAVAVAVRGEMAQCIGHFLKLAHLRFHLFDMLQRNALYIGRCPAAIAPQRQKVANLFD